ncbi:MAG: hypothetical protein R2860_02335 [Desulfobacterales bacterium]
MPFLYAPTAPANIYEKTVQAIESVGLAGRMQHRIPMNFPAGKCSGWPLPGPLSTVPKSFWRMNHRNLDSGTGTTIMHLLKGLNKNGTTLILVTHDHEIMAWASRTMTLRDGKFI